MSELGADQREAGRLVQLFFDLVGFLAADLGGFLLSDGFDDSQLEYDEQKLRSALTALRNEFQSLPAGSICTGWMRVEEFLKLFGRPMKQG